MKVYKKEWLKSEEVNLLIKDLTEKILKDNIITKIVIVGIRTRGIYLAKRIARMIKDLADVDIDVGYVDITLYRDDIERRDIHPQVKSSYLPFDISGKTIILIDDVIYTGRTVRAAIDELIDYGRPEKIKLAVLIDRGWRELPIQPDYVGKFIKTYKKEEIVRLHLKEVDNIDRVVLITTA